MVTRFPNLHNTHTTKEPLLAKSLRSLFQPVSPSIMNVTDHMCAISWHTVRATRCITAAELFSGSIKRAVSR
jgi:hypothetical protein